MPEVAGYLNQVWALAGAVAMTGSTGAKVLGVEKSTFNRLCDILEITAFGDTYKKRMGGLKDTEISFDGNLYAGDTTGQDIMIPGNSIYIGVYPQGTAVAGTQIPCIVESVEISSEVAGKSTIKVTVQANGAPVALPLRP